MDSYTITGSFRRRPESMLKAKSRQKGTWRKADMDSGRRRNDTEEGGGSEQT
jgi:hypothetical protein